MSIITVDDLKEYLGQGATSTLDERYRLVVDGVNAALATRTRRSWEKAARIETYRGSGTVKLALRHYPIASVASVTVDGVALDTTSSDVLQIRSRTGLLVRTDGAVWPCKTKATIVVTYTGGPDVPDDLRMAALELATYVHQATGGREAVSVDDVSQSFAVSALVGEAMTKLPVAGEVVQRHTDPAADDLEDL